jgi:hypothetical protein
VAPRTRDDGDLVVALGCSVVADDHVVAGNAIEAAVRLDDPIDHLRDRVGRLVEQLLAHLPADLHRPRHDD